jgi:hypothetical protein
MQAILSRYDIDNEDFYKMMRDTNGIIAGSAALCALVGGFEPGDIDIWIDFSTFDERRGHFCDKTINGKRIRTIINKYFTNNGYKLKKDDDDLYKYIDEDIDEDNEKYLKGESEEIREIINPEALDDMYSEAALRMKKIIWSIDRYKNEKGKNIQIIFTKMYVSVIDIVKSFDLSVSATWWKLNNNSGTGDSISNEGTIYTYDLTNTLNRVMYKIDDIDTKNSLQRIEKYKSYGFKLLDKDLLKTPIVNPIDPEFTGMSAILSKYNINDEYFYKTMHDVGGIIAGSAALCALVGGFEPGDIDIWIELSRFDSCPEPKNIYRLSNYFKHKGYNKTNLTHVSQYYDDIIIPKYTTVPPSAINIFDDAYFDDAYINESNKFHKIIYRIWRFENDKGQRIQIIWTQLDVSVMDAIKSFDLSVCATWFIPSGIKRNGEIFTHDLTNTLSRIMYRLDDEDRHNIVERIAKYKSYGFTIIDKELSEKTIVDPIDPESK